MTVLARLNDALASLLRDDPRRVLLGEDVRDGGSLGLSRATCADEALAARVLGTPLAPAASIGHAGGLALAGYRPIVTLLSAASRLEGFAPLRELARLSAHETQRCDVLFLAPSGPGFGLGGDFAFAPESALATIEGLRVVCLGDPRDASALLRQAAEFDDDHRGPTVLLLPRALLLETLEHDDDELETLERPLEAVHARREGAAATVFCWGEAVARTLEAVARADHDVNVIDIACLAPLDREGVIQAACHTGKIVIAHGGGPGNGIAAELAALIADEAILQLDAPIVRVSGDNASPSYTREHQASPSIDAISAALTRVVTY
jgi:pyruvate/2-oxoglutarate/acetoin dehydrogenase E1 component